jgi:hypothetical protein
VGIGKRGCRYREREPRDEAACLGLDGVLLGVFTGCGVQLLEIAVTFGWRG